MFRPEAVSFRAIRLTEDAAIAVPIAWQNIGFVIFGGVAAGVLFLSLASYSRVETVTGTITPDTGVASIVPTRAGVIAVVAVQDNHILTSLARSPLWWPIW